MKNWGFRVELACALLLALVLLIVAFSANSAGVMTVMVGGGGGGPLITTSLTAGSNVSSGNGEIGFCSNSVDCGDSSLGSLSVSAIPGGYTVIGIIDIVVSGSVAHAEVVVSGFSAEPAQNWLTSVIFNGQTYGGANASSYSYSSGTATWQWGTATGWAFVSSDVYPGVVGYQ